MRALSIFSANVTMPAAHAGCYLKEMTNEDLGRVHRQELVRTLDAVGSRRGQLLATEGARLSADRSPGIDGERLLGQWADAYARLPRPRMLIRRFYAPTLQGWKDWPLVEHGALWGGEPAGAILTKYLRPGTQPSSKCVSASGIFQARKIILTSCRHCARLFAEA